MMSMRQAALALALALLPAAAGAQTISPAIENASRCAPGVGTGVAPADAPRIVASQDSQARALFSANDLLVINAGTDKGLRVGQQFAIRQISIFTERRPGPRAVTTAGWLHIASTGAATSIAVVDLACGGILAGDYLEPLVTAPLPTGVDRTDASGQADFSTLGRVLFGEHEHQSMAIGDFIVVSTGAQAATTPGARFAIYRDMKQAGVPLAWIGEAVAVSNEGTTTIVRITSARDAVFAGDLLVPRR